jgi:hypothetical protein
MYVNHRYHVNATMRYLYIVDLHVAVNNIKSLNVAMQMQDRVPCALWSGYKTIRTAVRSTNILRSSCKVPNIVVRF